MTTHDLIPRHQALTRPARTRIAAALAAAVSLLCAYLIVVSDRADAVVPPPPPGWTQIWADDFTGPAGSLPSGNNWIFDLGHSYPGGPANWGTGEIAAHTGNPANVSVDGGGNLRITPLRDGSGNWTSARIETRRGDFKAPAGGMLRIEGRIQMPNVTGAAALGYWPAFWALGSPYRGNYWNWPGIGEFDIMENVNGINSVWGVLHCGTSPGGPCNEKNGIAANRACPGTSCQAGFHTYRFEWDRSVTPNQLRWYVDGQQFHSVRQDRVDAGTWANMTSHAGYFIILNVAIGGEFPNNVSGITTPVGSTVPGRPMVVDYVAVWTRTTGGSDPTSTTSTTGTTPPPTCGRLVSQGRPVSASSVESPNQAAAFAVDGNPGTRWSSGHHEPNWLQVDLGSVQPITRVRLNWEAAYATEYQIQLSGNGSTWTTAFETYSGAGGIEDIPISGNARYIRMQGIRRATPYGFSLWELEAFGACPGTTTPTSRPTSTTTGVTTTTTEPPPGGTWAPNTAYAVGQEVTYGGRRYRCRQAHTSIVSWEPPNAASLWEPVG
ncbi:MULTISPECIES: discoidin domain-containing protein [unclassified Crossiella]|uniref:discoidin domain-containing protein n=1 Tax=unclassified Crossiella TaxID=2620835 RepID=UPI001FFEE7E4|nr:MULTISPECIES: discoidin domain-containing protein [unclassified Crossiella]MCK2239532.1 discoidin domain-containing protein [Crossiella sp. S99.2]MCK2252227.1 discoidin domain-containing protein [Crossiella sp. S99.1]